MNTNIIQMITAMLAGGLITKLFQLLFISKKEKQEISIMMLNQLMKQVNFLNERVEKLQAELKEKDTSYQALLKEHGEMQVKYQNLKDELDRIKRKYPELKAN